MNRTLKIILILNSLLAAFLLYAKFYHGHQGWEISMEAVLKVLGGFIVFQLFLLFFYYFRLYLLLDKIKNSILAGLIRNPKMILDWNLFTIIRIVALLVIQYMLSNMEKGLSLLIPLSILFFIIDIVRFLKKLLIGITNKGRK